MSALIAVGSVDEVTASLPVTIKNAFGFVALGAVAPTSAEVTGAQRQFGNAQSCFTAEHFVMHGMTPEGWDLI
ncbi:hypothetical protein D3C86_2032810 [compost metagenome]